MEELIASHRAWLAASSVPRLASQIRTVPVDVADYEQTLRACGFPFPPSLRDLLTTQGLLQYPALRGDFGGWARSSCGLEMEDPDGLFDNHLHHLAEADAGVAQGGSWLVFATMRGDLDGAYALDRRFRRGDEVGVGTYHQDEVCHQPRAADEPLWDAAPDFESWLDSFLTAAREGIERSDRAALVEQLEQRDGLPPASPPPTWSEIWARLEREGHRWEPSRWGSYRRVMRQTDDPSVLEFIEAEVRADLSGKKGRATVPGLHQDMRSGYWTTGMPGPFELIARRPEHGRWGWRHLMHWALSRCGVQPAGEGLDALRVLADQQTPGRASEPERQRLASQCADRGWSTYSATDEPLEGTLARAMAWALGRATPARVAHVLRTAHALRRRTAGDMELSARRLWGLLSKIEHEGAEAVPEPTSASKPTGEALELARWLERTGGTQRERLASLKTQWLERLEAAPLDVRTSAARLIRKAIKSKKLVAERDALLGALEVEGERGS